MSRGDLRKVLRAVHKRPIAYYPVYKEITGSLTAGVLLSQLMYWFSMGKDKIFKTDKEIMQETGLTSDEVKGAKRRIKKVGFIKVSREGMPARTYYEIDWDKFLEVLNKVDEGVGNVNQDGGKEEILLGKTLKLDGGNSANCDKEYINNKNITETTTEITTENKVDCSERVKTRSEPPSYEEQVNNFFKTVKEQEWWKDFVLAFPNVTTNVELAKAKAWLLANRQKRKKDFKRFLYNWFAKAQDSYDRWCIRKGERPYGRRGYVEAVGETLKLERDGKRREVVESGGEFDVCKESPFITGRMGDGSSVFKRF